MAALGSVEHYQDVGLVVEAELGRMRMTLRDLLALSPGNVIAAPGPAGADLAVYVGGAWIGWGEVVILDKSMGIRLTEIGGPGR